MLGLASLASGREGANPLLASGSVDPHAVALYSCGHSSGVESTPAPLWADLEVPALGGDSGCKVFPNASSWCEHHGDEFCNSILDGDKDREDVPDGLPTVVPAPDELSEHRDAA